MCFSLSLSPFFYQFIFPPPSFGVRLCWDHPRIPQQCPVPFVSSSLQSLFPHLHFPLLSFLVCIFFFFFISSVCSCSSLIPVLGPASRSPCCYEPGEWRWPLNSEALTSLFFSPLSAPALSIHTASLFHLWTSVPAGVGHREDIKGAGVNWGTCVTQKTNQMKEV